MHGDSSLLVEFVGLPASGKSTLARAVETRVPGRPTTNRTYDLTHRSTHRYERKARMVAYALDAVAHQPDRSSRIVTRILRTEQRSKEETLELSIYSLYLRGLLRRLSKVGGIHLVDQGPLQASWSINLHAASPIVRPFTPLVEARGFAHRMVIVTDVGSRTSIERLRNRNTNDSRLSDAANVSPTEELERVVEWAPACADTHLRLNCESLPVEDAAAEIVERVLRAVSRADP